jgi:hypothetical protein
MEVRASIEVIPRHQLDLRTVARRCIISGDVCSCGFNQGHSGTINLLLSSSEPRSEILSLVVCWGAEGGYSTGVFIPEGERRPGRTLRMAGGLDTVDMNL